MMTGFVFFVKGKVAELRASHSHVARGRPGRLALPNSKLFPFVGPKILCIHMILPISLILGSNYP